MIVSTGKNIVTQFFGGQISQIADTIAFGTGTTAEALTDTALQTEVYRQILDSVNADLTNFRIVFKATVSPTSTLPNFTEVGLFNNGTLVARKVFAQPQVPDANLPTEIEYSMGIAIS